MKKDVFISIKGIQMVDSEKEVTELFTQGSFAKRNNHYYISYKDSEATGYENSTTTLKIEGNDKVTLIRHGESRSHLVVERGCRNIGHYQTIMGELTVGVNTRKIVSDLSDIGGALYFSYSLDINSGLVSENEVFIQVDNQDSKEKPERTGRKNDKSNTTSKVAAK